MRVTYALGLALAIVGCSRVDSDRTTSLDDHTRPVPASGEVARPEANVPDNAAPVPATSPPATSLPAGATSSTAGTTNTNRDITASGESPSLNNTTPNGTAPDNTAINQRDRDSAAKTPINQDENQSDVSKTAEIRQRIVNAENMSINARNVKIITSKGKVTLRGPVNSAAEREAIVRFAHDVAGEGNVDDQLELNTDPATSATRPESSPIPNSNPQP